MIVTNIGNEFYKNTGKTKLEYKSYTIMYTEAFRRRKFLETKVKIHKTKTLQSKNFIGRNEQEKTYSLQVNTAEKIEKTSRVTQIQDSIFRRLNT